MGLKNEKNPRKAILQRFVIFSVEILFWQSFATGQQFSAAVYPHQIHRGYTNKDGLPPGSIEKIVCDSEGIPHVYAADTFFVLQDNGWVEETGGSRWFEVTQEVDNFFLPSTLNYIEYLNVFSTVVLLGSS